MLLDTGIDRNEISISQQTIAYTIQTMFDKPKKEKAFGFCRPKASIFSGLNHFSQGTILIDNIL